MAKEYVFYCDTCGRVDRDAVAWIKLRQGLEMSTCPKCEVQISRKLLNVRSAHNPKNPVLRKGVVDTFNKYGGVR